jgi:putative ABC transport system ATP-binding protein
LDAGEILWNEEAVQGTDVPSFRGRVIYLHQQPAFTEGVVEDNLREPLSWNVHRDKQFNRARIIELLKSLNRDETFLSKRQRDLSGGEAQLAALLRAVQLNPAVLLLDEPTASLDEEATRVVEAVVRNWLDELPTKRATVWVTHDPAQAQRVSTTVLHIHEGMLA